MHLTEEDIRRLARLARLAMPASELGPVQAKLNAVMGLIESLQSVDTPRPVVAFARRPSQRSGSARGLASPGSAGPRRALPGSPGD
jgi:Asp-tRNA(Asn)/Glu-tRNA(Gln) amidotransferase C subunit